jgi:hypothetical protein
MLPSAAARTREKLVREASMRGKPGRALKLARLDFMVLTWLVMLVVAVLARREMPAAKLLMAPAGTGTSTPQQQTQ